MATVRVIRILEYEGDPEWVKKSLEVRGVKGVFSIGTPNFPKTIREGFVTPADPIPEWFHQLQDPGKVA